MSAPAILPPSLSAYLDGGEGAGAPTAHPETSRPLAVVDLPPLPPLMADEGYPVSGDDIARALFDRHPQNVSVHGRPLSRVPLGDMLGPMLAAAAHPGRA